MSEDDLRRWNQRYHDGSYSTRTHPSPLLERHLASFEPGRALDVACGAGRNALCLAAAGHAVDAVDISAAGLERARANALVRGLTVNWILADLEHGLSDSPDLALQYELIVLIRYVNMPLVAELTERLAPGGALVCEQHLVTRHEVAGPRNSAYRIGSNELLRAAAGLSVKLYREGVVEDPDRRRVALAQLIATRGAEPELIYC